MINSTTVEADLCYADFIIVKLSNTIILNEIWQGDFIIIGSSTECMLMVACIKEKREEICQIIWCFIDVGVLWFQ